MANADYIITQVADEKTKLALYINANKKIVIDKSCKLTLDGNYVFLYDNSQSAEGSLFSSPQVFRLLFSQITAPATANANALAAAILTMITTGNSAGDATAANQSTQINVANNTYDKILEGNASLNNIKLKTDSLSAAGVGQYTSTITFTDTTLAAVITQFNTWCVTAGQGYARRVLSQPQLFLDGLNYILIVTHSDL